MCCYYSWNLIKYKHLLLQNKFCYPTKVMAAFSKMQCLLAVTKTRTGLELDWRWTRTFMFLMVLHSLSPFWLPEEGWYDISATNIFYIDCTFNIPVLEWVKQFVPHCCFLDGETLCYTVHHPKLLIFFHWLNLPSICVHIFEWNWVTWFVKLYVIVFEQKWWD